MSASALSRAEHKGLSLFLAIAMHSVIAAFLIVGVQWQTKIAPPEQVELWAGALEAAPVEPPPPKPVPKPVEEPLPPPPKVPDIELEKPKPAPKVKPAPEKPTPTPTPTPKPQPKPVKQPETPPDANKGKTPSEQAGKLTAPPIDATASLAALAARQQAAEAGAKAGLWEAYYAQVRNKVRRNMTYPDDSGNPEVLLEVKLLPDMSILDASVVKSSGIPSFDDAVLRAVKRTEQYPPLTPGLDKSQIRSHKLKYKLRDGGQ